MASPGKAAGLSARVIQHRTRESTDRIPLRPVNGKSHGAVDGPCRERFQTDGYSIFAGRVSLDSENIVTRMSCLFQDLVQCALWKISGMERNSDLPTCLFIPENLVTVFCPDQCETLLFEDCNHFSGSEWWDLRHGPGLSGYIRKDPLP